MRYWWVNQNQTYRHEVPGGYLWSPVKRSDGARNYFYDTMTEVQPGDLVFFDGLGHVGLYIGGGQFIHAPHTGDFVKISSLTGWYDSGWVGARRIV